MSWHRRIDSRFFLIAGPILGGILSDSILIIRFSPETWDVSLAAALATQAALQWLAFCGICAILFAVAQWPRAVVRASSAGLFVGATIGLLVLDRLAFEPTFTGHWSLRSVRLAALAAAVCTLGFRLLRPNIFVPQRRLLTVAGIAIGLLVFATCMAFGGSLFPLTPKYLRESIQVLMVEAMAFTWLLMVVSSPLLSFKQTLAIFGAGFSLFLLGVYASPLLSFRSSYVIVTTAESTRSVRNASRHFARLLHIDGVPGISKYVGSRLIPSAGPFVDDPNVACKRVDKGRVQSVLLLTFDALRADFYGVPARLRPNLERFRAESLDFTNAIQTGSGTSESVFAFHVGRYPNEASPTRDAFPTLSTNLNLGTRFVSQDRDESDLHFAEAILAQVRGWRSSAEGFIFHAHFMSLHMPPGMARAHHDYPPILERLDAALGRVLDGLAELGLAETTLVVVTADHGEELFKERGYESHGYGNRQTLLHTPLFLRVPGIAPARHEELVSGVDIFPTFLDALGAHCNYPLHGQSLLRQGPRGPNGPVFGHSMGPGPAVKVSLFYSDIHSVILGSWKFVLNRAENAIALYDLKKDPNEHVNLADKQPARAAELGSILDQYLGGRQPDYGAHLAQ